MLSLYTMSIFSSVPLVHIDLYYLPTVLVVCIGLSDSLVHTVSSSRSECDYFGPMTARHSQVSQKVLSQSAIWCGLAVSSI